MAGAGSRVTFLRLALPCALQCEADAVAFTEEAQQGLQPSGHLPITAGGSYILAPAHAAADGKSLRVEMCMAKPSTGPLAPRLRTRVVCNLRRGAQDAAAWALDSIEVCMQIELSLFCSRAHACFIIQSNRACHLDSNEITLQATVCCM